MKTTRWQVSVLALLMALAACSKKSEETGSERADSAQAQAEHAASGAEVSGNRADPKNLGALVDLIVAEAADLPRAEFDPAALAAKLGKNPQAHFEWVRDHTWWAPYRGLLRGSKGVMLDRIGSNLDRAVLLGDLLRRSGHKVRLTHAQLTEGRARELLGKVRPIPEHRVNATVSAPMSAQRQQAIGELIPGFEESMQQQLAQSKRVADQAIALVRAQADELYAVARHAANGTGGVDGDADIAAMRDHWWVEREENGKWIAMDILLPDSRPGVAVATASSTSGWGTKDAMPSVPDSDWHSVLISVVVERYEDGAVSDSKVLEALLRPAELLEQPVTLLHKPKPWPDESSDQAPDPSALGNAAVSVREWVPILLVGNDLVVQSGFTDGGDLIASPFDPQRDIAATGGGGFMTGFGEALGGGETAASSMTAEWIDYEIRVPGDQPRRLRRPVFDLLGPANRAAKASGFDASTNERLVERYEALLSRTDILLQPCQFTGEFVADLLSAGIVAEQRAIKDLSRERDPAKARNLASEILGRMADWGPLPDLVLWRSSLGDQPGDSFIDRPNVLNYRLTRAVVDSDRGPMRESIDVASNATGVRTRAARDPFEVRMRQGVADTVAELAVLGSDFRMTENTASLFATAGPTAERGVFIAPRESGSVDKLGWGQDAAARLAADISAGYAAVALREPVTIRELGRVGWWQIDPRSGATIGVMDNGLNAAMTEKEITELKTTLRNFLKQDADYWRFLRGRIAQGHRFSQNTYNQLWQREAAMQILRDLAALGI